MAGDVQAGRAFVEVFLRDRLQAGLQRAAGRLNAFSRGVGAYGGAIWGAGSALAAPFIASLGPASDMAETMAKFSVVFGDQTEAVKAWGDEFAGQVGRSKLQVAEFLSGSQDLFVPIGFDPAAAEQLSKTVTGLAVDLASFNNMADADVFRDLQAALTGSGETMKKYGVIVSAAAVNQRLLADGLDPATATEAQKVTARLGIILEGTTSAQGDAIRTADGYANQLKRARAQVVDLATAIGGPLLDQLAGFLAIGNQGLGMLGGWIEANPELIQGAALVAGGVAAAGSALIALAGAGMALGFVLSGLGTVAGLAAGAVGLIGSAAAFVLSPVGLVLGAVLGLGGALFYWSGLLGDATDAARTFGGNVLDIFGEMSGGLRDALAAGDPLLAARILWAGLRAIWDAGLEALGGLWTSATERVRDGVAGILEPLGGFGEAVQLLVDRGGDALADLLGFVGDTVGGMAAALGRGDVAAAGEILWLSLRVAFARGSAWITTAWGETWAGALSLLDGVATTLRGIWSRVSEWIAAGLLRVFDGLQSVVGWLADIEAELTGTDVLGQLRDGLALDVEATIRTLRDDGDRQRAAAEAARQRRDDERAQALADKAAATERTLAELEARRRELLDAQAADGVGVSAADELRALVAQAREAAGGQAGLEGPDGDMKPAEQAARGLAAADRVTGTFSTAAAQRLGAEVGRLGGPEERTAQAAERTAENTDELVRRAGAPPAPAIVGP